MSTLLSIVIPTHNRARYAVHCINSVLALEDEDIEVVVSDTSTDALLQEMVASGRVRPDSRLVYSWTDRKLDMTGNHNRALDLARGEYVCLIGDDDTVSADVAKVARWAHEHALEVVAPQIVCNYVWPDFRSRYFGSGHASRLYLPGRPDPTKVLDSRAAYARMLENACQGTDLLPKIYHGLVRRSVTMEAAKRAGALFHGSSPDLSGACALALLTREFTVLDFPVTIPGASGGSNTGRSATNRHTGRLEAETQTAAFRDRGWSPGVPKYFSVETVWAHAGLRTIRALGEHGAAEFNYARLLSICEIKHPQFASELRIAFEECLPVVGLDRAEFRHRVDAAKQEFRRSECKRIARRLLRPTAAGGRSFKAGIEDISGCPNELKAHLQKIGVSWECLVAS